MLNKTILDNYLKQLQGATLLAVGRCANMAWFIFQCATGATCSLHVQCPFRVTKDCAVVLANGDMYVANASGEILADWDVSGANLFDKCAAALPKEDGFVVCKVTVSEYSDLCVLFENKSELRAFVNDSTSEEQWRLFEKDNADKEHLVAYPSRLELE